MDMMVADNIRAPEPVQELREALERALVLADQMDEGMVAIHIQTALDALRGVRTGPPQKPAG